MLDSGAKGRADACIPVDTGSAAVTSASGGAACTSIVVSPSSHASSPAHTRRVVSQPKHAKSLELMTLPLGSCTGGAASMALPIPNSPTFVGSRFAAQGVSFAPVNSLGLSASNGISLFLGF